MPLENPQSANHLAAEAGTFEPQRQNNFSCEVALDDADRDLIIMGLEECPLPNEENEEVELNYQNMRVYVAGKFMVDETTIVLKDFVDQDTRGALLRWRQLVMNKATGQVGLAANYKKTMNIVMTGPDGSSVRVCKLKGAWPRRLEGGNLDMKTGEMVLMTVTIRFDVSDWSDSISGIAA